jgi:hypothetical protein
VAVAVLGLDLLVLIVEAQAVKQPLELYGAQGAHFQQ